MIFLISLQNKSFNVNAKIKIVNKALFKNMTFDIYCDGKMVGTMNRYIILDFDDAGTYTLQAKMKFWETATVVVKVEENKTLNLRLRFKDKLFERLYISFLLMLPIMMLINVLVRKQWLQFVTMIIWGLPALPIIFYLIFKRKNVWVLEDDD